VLSAALYAAETARADRRVVVHACLPSRSHQPPRVKLFLAELRKVFQISGFEAQYTGAAPRDPLRVTE